MLNFKVKNKLLSLKMSEVSIKIKDMNMSDLLKVYEEFDALILAIFSIFEH